MELDHFFIFTTPNAPQIARLEALGLVPTYRRTHTGQGTANVCYCFENAFLELLWVTDEDDARSAAVARMQLAERAGWRVTGGSPFGIAWRSATPELAPPFATWACRPPYLPTGAAIDVAVESDDLQQPLLFTFPGSCAPSGWAAERRGVLQAPGGFARLELRELSLPGAILPSEALRTTVAHLGGALVSGDSDQHTATLTLIRHDRDALTLRLPACSVVNAAR